MIIKIKQLTLICGDIIALYAALFCMIGVRYGVFTQEYVGAHLMPFTVVFVFWIGIFYIAGLYDVHAIRTTFESVRAIAISVFSGSILAVILFYIIPYFHIAPKTSLVIFSIIYFLLGIGWRMLFSSIQPAYKKNVLIVGSNKETDELYDFFKQNTYVGYNIIGYLNTPPLLNGKELLNTIAKYNISQIIIAKKYAVPPHIREDIYRFAARGTEVTDSSMLYETVLKRMSLEFHEDLLSLEPYARSKKIYETIKNPLEFTLATILFCILSPLLAIIWTLVKLTSHGPGIYKQIRYGKHQKKFYILKFRTMVHNAEARGAQWAQKDDPRITALGAFLRYTHLDELPQIVNILRGDMSFVGPRAERPEFITGLLDKLPYYELRHVIKPGITGWAQISYRYGSSVDDARTKLQYDLYYIKHRSFLLDILIVLRTIKHFFLSLS